MGKIISREVEEIISDDFKKQLKKKVLSNKEINSKDYSLALSDSLQLHRKEVLSCDEKFCDYKSFHKTSILIGIIGTILLLFRADTGLCVLFMALIMFLLYLFLKKLEIKQERLLVKAIQDEILNFISIKEVK